MSEDFMMILLIVSLFIVFSGDPDLHDKWIGNCVVIESND